MEALSSHQVFLFEGFRLDRRGLFRRDEGDLLAPVEIGSRALDVLGVLLQRPGELVSRDEIMVVAWPGTVVEDNNLTVQISTLRRILDQERAEGSCIQTIPGRGYRFIAPVTRAEAASPLASVRLSGNGSGQIAGNGQSRDVVTPGPTGGVAHPRTSQMPPRFRRGVMASAIGALVLVAAAAVGIWYSPWSGDAHPAPRLSIIVLPFANLGNDPEQQYFADGITEDLTTDLSRIAGMVVISRTTACTYRGKPIDVRQIGRELNVRYVLEGSVRRSGDRIRCNAQLIDAETDAHIWAERFDLLAQDLLWLQDEVTGRIAIALDLELTEREAARPSEHPNAFEYILRARAAYNRDSTRESFSEAISFCELALTLDPASIQARGLLARTLTARVLDQLTDTPVADLERAEALIRDVLAISPRDPVAHLARGQLLRAQGQFEAAIPAYERAVALDRNWVTAIAALGLCKFLAGAIEEAIPAQEQAIRLSPRDSHLPNWYWRIGMVHLLKARIDDAISWLEQARSANPRLAGPRAWLAAAYALAGNSEGATAELVQARRLSGDNRYASIGGFKRAGALGAKMQALAEETFFAGLRKAGVPEK